MFPLPKICVGIIFAVAAAGAETESQKKIVADFEDFGTWRIKDNSGLMPGVWWPAETGLGGSDAAKGKDELVGELKFGFGPAGTGPFHAGFERAKMSQVSGFLDGIEWEADAKELPVSLRFQIQDAANKVFVTQAVPLSGNGWRHYRLDITADTLRGFAQCKFPARLKRVTVEASTPCQGSIFLDDLAVTGQFTTKDRLSITPIYEKIAYLPGEEISLRYRIRNILPEPVSGTLRIEVSDFAGKRLLAKESSYSVNAKGSSELAFPVGQFPLGAYEVALTTTVAGHEFKEQDNFVVMIPNAGRPNKQPMWFGIADSTAWQADLENRRHWEWMRLLGVDINRMGIFAERFEPQEGQLNEAGWTRMIQGHAEAGIDILILYSDTPKWTHTKWKWRTPPDLGDKFELHAQHLGEYLLRFPNITYLEFWNEPDLDFFEGTLEEYLKIFGHFSKGLKKSHPRLQIASGGVTVQHPHEKKDFSRLMYERGGDLYDAAAYHSHGPLVNTEDRHKQVVAWLQEAGLGDKRILNTETGDRSFYTPEGRRRQAITLAKKVIYSKAQPNFDAYFWFTLQDYWDMDPEADDSFGLISSDNRAKPSFAVYNTLIRALANTTPVAEAPTAKDLSLHAFKRSDGRYVYAGWPAEAKSGAILWIRTPQKLEVSDLFGNSRAYAPLGGIVPIATGALPFYISGATPNEHIEVCRPGEEFLPMEPEIRYTESAKPVAVPVRFRNPETKTVKGTLALLDGNGRKLASHPFSAEARQEIAWSPDVVPDQVERGDLQLELLLTGGEESAFSFPLKLINSYTIRKVAPLGNDPASWPALDGVPTLILDRPEQVFELAYDPKIPAWKGPQDLSATARVVHDGAGIRFRISVVDDLAGPSQARDQMWRGDDLQVAFGRGDAKKFTILDVGASATGSAVWCSQHENSEVLGQWNPPVSIVKSGNVTTYDVYLPFDKLGLSASSKNIRFTFLVNENDGNGRIRWIEWSPGIARDRSIESLGHGQLE